MTDAGLAGAVADALSTLEGRPDGHLPLQARRRVRAAMGAGQIGHRRRLRLAQRAAEAVLARWRAEMPGDDRPEHFIELAERVFAGEADGNEASAAARDFASDVIDMLEVRISEPAVDAAMAADRLVEAARWDEDAERLDETADDEDVDSSEWETAFYASMVEAPSLPKMGIAEHVDPRRRFWRWYLEEALPAAHRSH